MPQYCTPLGGAYPSQDPTHHGNPAFHASKGLQFRNRQNAFFKPIKCFTSLRLCLETTCVANTRTCTRLWYDRTQYTGWRKKRGHPISWQIFWKFHKRIGELLQCYMLKTVINFLFKSFIALWRHLAKTQLLCDAQIYLYSVNKRQ